MEKTLLEKYQADTRFYYDVITNTDFPLSQRWELAQEMGQSLTVSWGVSVDVLEPFPTLCRLMSMDGYTAKDFGKCFQVHRYSTVNMFSLIETIEEDHLEGKDGVVYHDLQTTDLDVIKLKEELLLSRIGYIHYDW